LVLKLSAPDLEREFKLALEAALKTVKPDSGKQDMFQGGLTLSLEPLDGPVDNLDDDFSSSIALFERVRAKAREQKLEGMDRFNKDVFLNALRDAFAKARVEQAEIAKLMPCAGRALNTELLAIYRRLDTF
jgi:hypothetical protein